MYIDLLSAKNIFEKTNGGAHVRNQIILWSMFIVPWLTLFFMKKEEVRRYIPVALFAAATSVIIHDVGLRLGFWVIQDVAFPF